jgi:D-arabinose 1-dehydrogenase-like Zn-dependent alcohol dehydrogenase
MSSTTRAVVITVPGRAGLREFSTRPLQPHELRVANTFSAVSVGTEYLVVSGQIHDSVMPRLLGYQAVGRVIEIGHGRLRLQGR